MQVVTEQLTAPFRVRSTDQAMAEQIVVRDRFTRWFLFNLDIFQSETDRIERSMFDADAFLYVVWQCVLFRQICMPATKIGRASCRERMEISGVAGDVKKKKSY